MKTSKFETVDKTQRARGIPVSGPILQQKTIDISEDIPLIEAPENFKESER